MDYRLIVYIYPGILRSYDAFIMTHFLFNDAGTEFFSNVHVSQHLCCRSNSSHDH